MIDKHIDLLSSLFGQWFVCDVQLINQQRKNNCFSRFFRWKKAINDIYPIDEWCNDIHSINPFAAIVVVCWISSSYTIWPIRRLLRDFRSYCSLCTPLLMLIRTSVRPLIRHHKSFKGSQVNSIWVDARQSAVHRLACVHMNTLWQQQ